MQYHASFSALMSSAEWALISLFKNLSYPRFLLPVSANSSSLQCDCFYNSSTIGNGGSVNHIGLILPISK